MKYLRTYEQISNGDYYYLILTSDKKHFVKYGAALHQSGYGDFEVSGVVLIPSNEIHNSDFINNERDQEVYLEMIKQKRGDKFVITPDITCYKDTSSSIENEYDNADLAEIILDAIEESDIVQDAYDEGKIRIDHDKCDEILNDLIVVRFFVGHQEVSVGEEDKYLNA